MVRHMRNLHDDSSLFELLLCPSLRFGFISWIYLGLHAFKAVLFVRMTDILNRFIYMHR